MPSPFKQPAQVRIGLSGKSKSHVVISDNSQNRLTVPIELLNDADDVLSDTNARKRSHECVVAAGGGNDSQNVPKKITVQRCRQCGILDSPGNPVVNQGCRQHPQYARLYKRLSQTQRRHDPKQKRHCLPLKGIGNKCMNKFNKITTYYRDVILPATQLAAFYSGVTEELNPWKAMKKFGLAYVANLVHISADEFKVLHANMSGWEWRDQLFTNFDVNNGGVRFLNEDEENRWVTTKQEHIDIIRKWNRLEETVNSWLNNRSNFPIAGQEWKVSWSAFKTGKLVK